MIEKLKFVWRDRETSTRRDESNNGTPDLPHNPGALDISKKINELIDTINSLTDKDV